MSSYGSTEAEILRSKLIETHIETSMEDFFKGEEIETKQGSCYKISKSRKLKLSTISPVKAKNNILNDLKLIRGIGDSKAEILRTKGFKTIEDLKEHPRYGDEACRIVEIVDQGDFSSITNYVSNRYPKSHPSALYSSCFSPNENYLFMDIETLGLKGVPLILIGVARVESKNIIVDQYLLRDIGEEGAALEAFLSHVDEDTVFVSFNGQTFDIPYIKDRLKYHGIKKDIQRHHLDLLHFSRRAWKNKLPNCQLQTLEKHLFNFEREDDVPSSMVPSFYKTYDQTGNIGPLIPIVEHNREDVITLARILSRLHTEMDI
jgi:uncharacterized protein YprB with RNaseH-like and TPR domain